MILEKIWAWIGYSKHKFLSDSISFIFLGGEYWIMYNKGLTVNLTKSWAWAYSYVLNFFDDFKPHNSYKKIICDIPRENDGTKNSALFIVLLEQ